MYTYLYLDTLFVIHDKGSSVQVPDFCGPKFSGKKWCNAPRSLSSKAWLSTSREWMDGYIPRALVEYPNKSMGDLQDPKMENYWRYGKVPYVCPCEL